MRIGLTVRLNPGKFGFGSLALTFAAHRDMLFARGSCNSKLKATLFILFPYSPRNEFDDVRTIHSWVSPFALFKHKTQNFKGKLVLSTMWVRTVVRMRNS